MKNNNFFKRIMGTTLAMAMAVSVLLPSVAAAAPKLYNEISKFGAGSPTVRATTITIMNEADLITHLGSGTSGDETEGNIYKLDDSITNLDMTGKNFIPVTEFKGTFDGNNKTIENLTINTTTAFVNGEAAFVRALGYGASIKNVTFENPKITGETFAATIAVKSKGDINNVYVDNAEITVTGSSNTVVAGGLVGTYQKHTDTVAGTEDIGQIKNSIFTGSISGGEGRILPATNVGGLIGRNEAGNAEWDKVQNVFWDMDTTPGVTKAVGNSVSYKIPGAVGIGFTDSIKDNGNVKNMILGYTMSDNAVVKIVPETARLSTMNWAIDPNGANAFLERDSVQGIFLAKNPGSSKVTLTVGTANAKNLEKELNIRVVTDKEALGALIEQAEEEYPDGVKDDYNENNALYPAFTAALRAAKTTFEKEFAPAADVTRDFGALENAIKDLVSHDKITLGKLLTDVYSIYITEQTSYEANTFKAFKEAYSASEKIVGAVTPVTSTEVRKARDKSKETFDALIPFLQDATTSRIADDKVELIFGGYKHAVLNSDLATDDIPTVKLGDKTISCTYSVTGSTNADKKMILTISKESMGNENYNKGAELKISLKKGNKSSIEMTAKLAPADNFVLGDVKDINHGKIELGKNLSDIPTEIGGIKLTYNPETGEDNQTNAKGNVTAWEYDTSKMDEEGNPINATLGSVGTVYLVGTIKDSKDYKNPDGYKAYASILVIDRTFLASALKEASVYVQSNYTEASWRTFYNAYNEAKAIDASPGSTQKQIDDATAKLMDAIGGLRAQPKIVLKQKGITLKIGEFFEPLTYVTSVTDITNPDIKNTLSVKKGDFVIWQDGVLVNPLPTGTEGTHSIVYSVTNNHGVTASETMTVNVVSTTSSSSSSGGTGGSSSSSSGSGGGNAVISPGKNVVSSGDVSLEFTGTDIFTQDEIDKGAKLILEVKKIKDEKNIKGVLEKIAKLLKGEVTIDGIYDIKIFKEIEGKKSSIANSDIKGSIGVYLPISQKAIDSKDNAVIHVLENGGYELHKGSVQQLDGKNVTKVTIKGFSEFGVVYGGNISQVAEDLDTTGTTTEGGDTTTATTPTTGGGNGANTTNNNGANGNGTNATNQGGGEDGSDATTEESIVKAAATGDTSKILIISLSGLILAAGVIIIAVKKKQVNNK